MVFKFMPNDNPARGGKIADAEVHFTDGPLAGLRLLGFAIWTRRTGTGRNVTFPARTYSVNGERRSAALLRPVDDAAAGAALTAQILAAFAEFETERPASTAGLVKP